MTYPVPPAADFCRRDDSLLLVVDFQEKLARVVQRPRAVEANLLRLVKAAERLGVPRIATVQYPQGLGPLVPSLRGFFPDPPAKLTFSCCRAPGAQSAIEAVQRGTVVVCGIETHICVCQTSLDLLSSGVRVFVVADACSSRRDYDHDVALERLRGAGAVVTTTEAVLFEWLEQAGTEEFREVSRLVRMTDEELLGGAARPSPAAS